MTTPTKSATSKFQEIFDQIPQEDPKYRQEKYLKLMAQILIDLHLQCCGSGEAKEDVLDFRGGD